MSVKKQFTDSDLQRIKSAVKDAEDKISGEIVPVIVDRSGLYSVATYKSSLMAAALTFVTMILVDRYVINDTVNTLFYDPLFIFIMVVIGGLIGAALPNFLPGYKRLLVSQSQFDIATRQRAETAFLQEEVFNTRHRTGIMIFISFFEHEVIVMSDRGISKVVEQKQWDKIVADLISSIRDGKMIDGIEHAVKRCGEILLEKGFVKTADDVNELRDDLRIDG